ncbi:hypothetical protein [Luteimonas huabeiensis]|uniref:hypothetical protein n=1 Tax=Luteimonas huabeiensis TaxID=1244513 RepID=UPI0004661764|nr:hypothetical protein [Luteimonas huabeiensis]
MDWERIREAWQRQPTDGAAQTVSLQSLRERDRALARAVRTRDRVEAVAAVLVLAFFALVGVAAGLRGAWWVAASAAWIAAWAAWLPWTLRRARHAVPEAAPDQPLVLHLQRRRDAALVQARLLDRAWRWYVAPPMLGASAFVLASSGPTPGALITIAAFVAFGMLAVWLNRRAAKDFHAHAAALQRQIDPLAGDSA